MSKICVGDLIIQVIYFYSFLYFCMTSCTHEDTNDITVKGIEKSIRIYCILERDVQVLEKCTYVYMRAITLSVSSDPSLTGEDLGRETLSIVRGQKKDKRKPLGRRRKPDP